MHGAQATAGACLQQLFGSGAVIALSQAGVLYRADTTQQQIKHRDETWLSHCFLCLTHSDDGVLSTDPRTHLLVEQSHGGGIRLLPSIFANAHQSDSLYVSAYSDDGDAHQQPSWLCLLPKSSFPRATCWHVYVFDDGIAPGGDAAVVQLHSYAAHSTGVLPIITAEALLVPGSSLSQPLMLQEPAAGASQMHLELLQLQQQNTLDSHDVVGIAAPENVLESPEHACGSGRSGKSTVHQLVQRKENNRSSGSTTVSSLHGTERSMQMHHHTQYLYKLMQSMFLHWRRCAIMQRPQQQATLLLWRRELRAVFKHAFMKWCNNVKSLQRSRAVSAERLEQARALLAERYLFAWYNRCRSILLRTHAADSKYRQRLASREMWCLKSWVSLKHQKRCMHYVVAILQRSQNTKNFSRSIRSWFSAYYTYRSLHCTVTRWCKRRFVPVMFHNWREHICLQPSAAWHLCKHANQRRLRFALSVWTAWCLGVETKFEQNPTSDVFFGRHFLQATYHRQQQRIIFSVVLAWNDTWRRRRLYKRLHTLLQQRIGRCTCRSFFVYYIRALQLRWNLHATKRRIALRPPLACMMYASVHCKGNAGNYNPPSGWEDRCLRLQTLRSQEEETMDVYPPAFAIEDKDYSSDEDATLDVSDRNSTTERADDEHENRDGNIDDVRSLNTAGESLNLARTVSPSNLKQTMTADVMDRSQASEHQDGGSLVHAQRWRKRRLLEHCFSSWSHYKDLQVSACEFCAWKAQFRKCWSALSYALRRSHSFAESSLMIRNDLMRIRRALALLLLRTRGRKVISRSGQATSLATPTATVALAGMKSWYDTSISSKQLRSDVLTLCNTIFVFGYFHALRLKCAQSKLMASIHAKWRSTLLMYLYCTYRRERRCQAASQRIWSSRTFTRLAGALQGIRERACANSRKRLMESVVTYAHIRSLSSSIIKTWCQQFKQQTEAYKPTPGLTPHPLPIVDDHAELSEREEEEEEEEVISELSTDQLDMHPTRTASTSEDSDEDSKSETNGLLIERLLSARAKPKILAWALRTWASNLAEPYDCAVLDEVGRRLAHFQMSYVFNTWLSIRSMNNEIYFLCRNNSVRSLNTLKSQWQASFRRVAHLREQRQQAISRENNRLLKICLKGIKRISSQYTACKSLLSVRWMSSKHIHFDYWRRATYIVRSARKSASGKQLQLLSITFITWRSQLHQTGAWRVSEDDRERAFPTIEGDSQSSLSEIDRQCTHVLAKAARAIGPDGRNDCLVQSLMLAASADSPAECARLQQAIRLWNFNVRVVNKRKRLEYGIAFSVRRVNLRDAWDSVAYAYASLSENARACTTSEPQQRSSLSSNPSSLFSSYMQEIHRSGRWSTGLVWRITTEGYADESSPTIALRSGENERLEQQRDVNQIAIATLSESDASATKLAQDLNTKFEHHQEQQEVRTSHRNEAGPDHGKELWAVHEQVVDLQQTECETIAKSVGNSEASNSLPLGYFGGQEQDARLHELSVDTDTHTSVMRHHSSGSKQVLYSREDELKLFQQAEEHALQRVIKTRQKEQLLRTSLQAMQEQIDKQRSILHMRWRRQHLSMQGALQKWAHVVQEEEKRRAVVESNVRMKRITTNRMLRWYWDAFEHVVDEAERAITQRTDEALSVGPPSAGDKCAEHVNRDSLPGWH